MEIDSASRDLKVKSMTYNINTLNNLMKEKGFREAKIYTKSEAIEEGSKPDDLLRARLESRTEDINETVSKTLKIKVTRIVWNSNNTVKIDYLEK